MCLFSFFLPYLPRYLNVANCRLLKYPFSPSHFVQIVKLKTYDIQYLDNFFGSTWELQIPSAFTDEG